MKIGVLTASISRRAGGLFWSVRSLAEGVKRAGCEIKVFSVADSFSEEDAVQWQGLDLNVLPRRGSVAFSYAPGLGLSLDEAGLDLVHTHGLWMYPSVAALRWSKRWERPLVVSPRGMLDPWAVRNSAWKKRLAGMLFEHAHLRCVACLHALCESEYQSIRSYGLSNPVAIIPNGVDLPDLSRVQPQPDWAADLPTGSQVLLFLSRIHPKKGLTNFLRAWALVRQQASVIGKPWHLVIAGWDQGGHEAELQQLVATLGLDQSVHFVGPQFDAQKAISLARADAFVLPSFSEGLPMAVLEAWSYRLPVLMTDACNIPEGFQSGAAACLPLDSDGMVSVLADFLVLDVRSLQEMGAKGQDLVERRFTWDRIGREMLEVYSWVSVGGPAPDTVIIN